MHEEIRVVLQALLALVMSSSFTGGVIFWIQSRGVLRKEREEHLFLRTEYERYKSECENLREERERAERRAERAETHAGQAQREMEEWRAKYHDLCRRNPQR